MAGIDGGLGMMRSFAGWGWMLPIVVAGCATKGQRFDGWAGLKGGDRITVMPLADHPSDDPKDSERTGITCQNLIAGALKQRLAEVDVNAPVPADYDPKRGYEREQAVAAGRQRSSNYVLYGRCQEFYNVAPMTFRSDRGGIDVEVASVSDGRLVYRLIAQSTASNFSTPEAIIGDIAESMADDLKAK
jgi:hypothetical protein